MRVLAASCGSGPYRSVVKDGPHLRNGKAPRLSRLGLNPDSTVAKFDDAIVETFRHEISERRLATPLPEKNQHGNPVLVVKASTGPRA